MKTLKKLVGKFGSLKLERNQLKILLPALAFAASLLLIPQPAHASAWLLGIDSVVGWVFGWAVFVLNYIIALIFGVGFAIISYFIAVVLQLNTNLVNSLIVTKGFSVTLAVANLGFVLAIIVIAIATILRYETYGIKKVLWKLVAAAILVNFSLVIAGSILNFSDQLTGYFLNSFNPGGNGSSYTAFATAIAGAFRPQSVFLNISTQAGAGNALNVDAFQAAGQSFGAILTILLNLVFPTLFLIIAVIALGAFWIMLLIRYIYLAILLILMPLAWLCWILPITSSQWNKWWHSFIKWTFFAPIVIFFVYLAILTMGGSSAEQGKGADPNAFFQGLNFKSDSPMVAAISNVTGNAAATFLGNMLQMATMTGLLIAGLMMGQAMGITFAGAAVGAATAVGVGFGKMVGRASKRTGMSLVDRVKTAGRQYNPATEQTTSRLQRIGSRLQGIPGLRGAGSFISRQGTEVTRKRPEDVENYRKSELESLDNEGVIARATSGTAFFDPMKAAAIGQELARRNITADPRVAGQMDRFVQTAERVGSAQNIYNNRPDLIMPRPGDATHPPETPEQAIARAVRDTKMNIPQIDHHALGNYANAAAAPTNEQINIALNISNPQLGRLGSEGSAQQIEALRNTVRQASNQFTAGTLALNAEQAAQLQRIIYYTDNNPNWQNIV